MNVATRARVVRGLLAASLLLNLGTLGYLANSGGLRRFLIRMDWADVSAERAAFMEQDEARFRKMPSRPGEAYLAGDSLVAAGPWAEFYTGLHTRGIGGETTSGLLRRLDEITARRPGRIILLVGANDLAAAVAPDRVVRNYRAILERIRAEAPVAEVTVVGVLPVNRGFASSPTYSNDEVRRVNRGLKALVDSLPGVRFLDLTDALVDGSGELRPEFTTDGLHMTIDGYLAIRERLGGVVPRGGRSEAPPEAATP